MQFAKDSFYMALRTRLAALNPHRMASVDGVSMAAILVNENSADYSEKPLPETYYLSWGACRVIEKRNDTPQPLFGVDCEISYWTSGTSHAGVDRGRVLAQLDSDLLAICTPATTPKQDFTQSPSVDLGTRIFWTLPTLNKVESGDSRQGSAAPSRSLRRTVTLTVFFFPEAN